MNRQEYINSKNKCNTYYKHVHKLLKEWKIKNNIIETCVVHHRDDIEECVKYNSEHYELWGCEEDGTFKYGKYVLFMTRTEHAKYHRIGSKHSEETKVKLSKSHKGQYKGDRSSMYGKHHSTEAKAKIRASKLGDKNPMYGKALSDDTKAKLSVAQQARLVELKFLYTTYKNNGGDKKWNDFQKALRNGEITFSDYEITFSDYEITV